MDFDLCPTYSYRLIKVISGGIFLIFFLIEFEDYSQIDTTLQFDDNIREHRVIFQIFDDLLSEGLETFRLELRNTEDPNTVTTSSLVEIVDDESEL